MTHLHEFDREFGLILLGLSISMHLDVIFDFYSFLYLVFSLTLGIFVPSLYSSAVSLRRKAYQFCQQGLSIGGVDDMNQST
jgi:hypothetical protein